MGKTKNQKAGRRVTSAAEQKQKPLDPRVRPEGDSGSGARGPLGPRPTLAWIDKNLLTVDPAWQRELSQQRSQALIAKLAAGYCWAHGSCLIVAKSKRGPGADPAPEKYIIIDGQHRHAAALRRDDIAELPCLVVHAPAAADQARAFIAHNRDRVNLTSLALFHAGVAAGDAHGTAVVRAAAAAGVKIAAKPMAVADLPADTTLAVGALRQICMAMGEAGLARVLRIARAAWPDAKGQLMAEVLKAIARLTAEGRSDAAIRAALNGRTSAELEHAARSYRIEGQKGSMSALVAKAIMSGAIMSGAGADPAPKKVIAPGSGATASAPGSGATASAPAKPLPRVGVAHLAEAAAKRAAQAAADEQAKAAFIAKHGVRRFEAAPLDELIRRTMAEAGYAVTYNWSRSGHRPWVLTRTRGSAKGATERKSLTELIAAADALRKAKGLTPIGTTARPGSARVAAKRKVAA